MSEWQFRGTLRRNVAFSRLSLKNVTISWLEKNNSVMTILGNFLKKGHQIEKNQAISWLFQKNKKKSKRGRVATSDEDCEP